MMILMVLVGAIAWLFGFFVLSHALSAVHEIEALIALLLGTVAFGFAGAIDATKDLKKAVLAMNAPVDVANAPPRPKLDWLGRRVG